MITAKNLSQESLKSLQEEISESMRVTLIDWMFEVCSEFGLKRETCHLAIRYLDRALLSVRGIKKHEFQLIGLVSMCLASKMEEVFPPRLEAWAKSADNGFSISQIKQTERKLLGAFHWNLVSITPYTCLNHLMSQWDTFLEYHFACVPYNNPKDFKAMPVEKKKIQRKMYENRMIYFKKTFNKSYKRFRECLHVLDTLSLLWSWNMFSPAQIAASVLYLVISKHMFLSKYAILHFGSHSQANNYQNAVILEDLYRDFLKESLEINDICEIYPALLLVHPFLQVSPSFSLPAACSVIAKDKLQSHYEEFLAFQTYDSKAKGFALEILTKI